MVKLQTIFCGALLALSADSATIDVQPAYVQPTTTTVSPPPLVNNNVVWG